MPEEAPVTPVTPTPAEGGAVQATAPIEATVTAGETVLSLEDLQKELTKVRQEAAGHRVAAKTAAEQAEKALTDKLAVALGLKPDAATDPAALTASLTEAQSQAKSAARELAIFKAAAATGADPSRLLDSNSFMTSVTGLDPADGAAISAAITAATTANPLLKAVQAAAASGTELGGSGETGQITDEQLARMSPEEITKALKEGKLAHLL